MNYLKKKFQLKTIVFRKLCIHIRKCLDFRRLNGGPKNSRYVQPLHFQFCMQDHNKIAHHPTRAFFIPIPRLLFINKKVAFSLRKM